MNIVYSQVDMAICFVESHACRAWQSHRRGTVTSNRSRCAEKWAKIQAGKEKEGKHRQGCNAKFQHSGMVFERVAALHCMPTAELFAQGHHCCLLGKVVRRRQREAPV